MRAAADPMVEHRVPQLIRRHPVVTFFVLAYALTWWVYPLLVVSPFLGFLGLFIGPAVLAVAFSLLQAWRAGAQRPGR